MTPLGDRESLNAINNTGLLQCLIWGEARGESIEGKVGVAWVVKNRVEVKPRIHRDWKEVILKRKQFSCFNDGDPNLDKILEQYVPLRVLDPVWRLCRFLAHGVIYNWVEDNTKGANHYCVIGTDPYWAEGVEPVAVIDSHEFYLL